MAQFIYSTFVKFQFICLTLISKFIHTPKKISTFKDNVHNLTPHLWYCNSSYRKALLYVHFFVFYNQTSSKKIEKKLQKETKHKPTDKKESRIYKMHIKNESKFQ